MKHIKIIVFFLTFTTVTFKCWGAATLPYINLDKPTTYSCLKVVPHGRLGQSNSQLTNLLKQFKIQHVFLPLSHESLQLIFKDYFKTRLENPQQQLSQSLMNHLASPSSSQNAPLHFTPLFEQYKGLWAHNLLRPKNQTYANEGDFRTINSYSWSGGVVFPVEIFNSVNIKLVTKLTPEYLKSQGVDKTFDLDNPEEALPILLKYLSNNESSFLNPNDIYSRLTFSAQLQNMSFDSVDFLWVPQPILSKIVPENLENLFLGLKDIDFSSDDRAFQTQIFINNENNEKVAVTPPEESTQWRWSPHLRVGSWFNVFPDLSVIRESLRTRP